LFSNDLVFFTFFYPIYLFYFHFFQRLKKDK